MSLDLEASFSRPRISYVIHNTYPISIGYSSCNDPFLVLSHSEIRFRVLEFLQHYIICNVSLYFLSQSGQICIWFFQSMN